MPHVLSNQLPQLMSALDWGDDKTEARWRTLWRTFENKLVRHCKAVALTVIQMTETRRDIRQIVINEISSAEHDFVVQCLTGDLPNMLKLIDELKAGYLALESDMSEKIKQRYSERIGEIDHQIEQLVATRESLIREQSDELQATRRGLKEGASAAAIPYIDRCEQTIAALVNMKLSATGMHETEEEIKKIIAKYPPKVK